MLEKAQRTVAKIIQGLARRTHNEIVIGLLGWITIEGIMDQMKLNFVWKLANMKPTSLTKHIFLHEIYNVVLCKYSANITCNLFDTLKKYDMIDFIHRYIQGGELPGKQAWKSMVKDNIQQQEQIKWINGLHSKHVFRYCRVQPTLSPNRLYGVIQNNLHLRDSIMVMVRLLTIVDDGDTMLCSLCGKIATDFVEHVMMRCEGLLTERNCMWNKILDNVDVHVEVKLLNKTDDTMLDILLGSEWDIPQDALDVSTFTITVSEFINCAIDRLAVSMC